MSKISDLSDGGVIQGGDTLIAVRSGGNVKVTYGGSTTANIDGGTIDGTVIGGTTAAAGSFTSLTSTGIDVSGTVSADGLTVNTTNGSSVLEGTGISSVGLQFKTNASNRYLIQTPSASADLTFLAGGTTKSLNLGSGGDISFYEDTGTSPKMVWSASNESLTFGTNLAITTNEIDVATGDLTLDVAGQISLDADNAGSIKLLDGGSFYGQFFESGNSFYIASKISDGDMFFQGNDGGSTITALSIDMSNAGAATFNSTVTSTAFGSQLATTSFVQNAITTTVGSSSGAFIRMAVSSAGNPTYAFDGDTDTGMFTSGSNTLNFSTASTERMRIDASGNLLVGTTSSSSNTAGIKLSSAGTASFVRSGVQPVYVNRLTNDGDLAVFAKDGTTVGTIGTVNGDMYVGTGDTGLFFSDGANYIMPYNVSALGLADGLLDLGRGTNRFKDLYLSGNVNTSGNSFTATTSGYFFGGAGSYANGIYGVGVNNVAINANGTERMRIDSSGNLLVGTTDVDLGFTDGDSGFAVGAAGYIQAARDSANAILYLNKLNNDGTIIQMHKDGSTVGTIGTRAGDLSIGTGDTGLNFWDASDKIIPENVSTGAARDDAISLGASGVRFKDLYLSGTANAEKVSAVRTNGVCGEFNRSNNGHAVQFFHNSVLVGSVSVTGTATTYNTSSDQRLKANIVDAPSASDDIDAIQVRSFDWKADGSHQKYGMIAQELNTVAPEAVSEGETEEDMLGVDYSKLVPMLVKEIQSLRARVAQLETN